MNLNDIKLELQKYGNAVINISNIGHGTTKNPLSLFFIDLKQKPNDQAVYNIKRLMNSAVKIELFRRKGRSFGVKDVKDMGTYREILRL